MILGFITLKTIFLIAHLFGVAIGLGGAFASDLMFMHATGKRTIADCDVAFLALGGRIVMFGLALLILSGLGLFLLNVDGYMASTKFMAKMTIVGILIVNGIFMHVYHLPLLARSINIPLTQAKELQEKRRFLLISGAISFVSWCSALILGAFSAVPYSYLAIMCVYTAVLLFGITVSLMLKNVLLPAER